MRSALFGFSLLLAAATHLEAAGVPIPPEIKNVVSFDFQWLRAGFDNAGNLYAASVVDFMGPPPSTATVIGPACSICLVVAKVSGGQLLHMTAIGGLTFGTSGTPGTQNVSYSEEFAMHIDPEGDVFLAGGYASSNFPTTEGAFEMNSTTGGAYLLKMDPSGTKLLFSTFIGSNPNQTLAYAIALDSEGDIFVGGYTAEPAFPTTPGALQRGSSIGQAVYAGFVCKFSPAGSLVASTLFGGGAKGDATAIAAIAIDTYGMAHIAGLTGTYSSQGFVARLNSSLTGLLFSIPLSDSPNSIKASSTGDSYVAGALTVTKVDAGGAIVYQTPLPSGGFGALLLKDGSIAVAGMTGAVSFPTKDTLEACPPDRAESYFDSSSDQSGVFAVLDPTGQVTFSTLLGGTQLSEIGSVLQDPAGDVYLAGIAFGADFPGGPILGGFNAGVTAFVFELDLGAIPQGIPFPACLLTSGGAYAPAAPGMIVTLYGNNLGPSTGASFRLDASGRVPTQLAGTSVTVGGLPAPILYAQDGQINFVVPLEIQGQTTTVCVTSSSGQNCISPPVQPLFPLVFYTPGVGYAILNQDGTLNTPSNPALRGSYVTLFGTGMGPYDRGLPDGSIVGPPLANLTASFSAIFPAPTPVTQCGEMFFPPCPPPNTTSGKVLFAGAAPGEVAGVTQINLVIPDNSVSGPEVGFQLVFGQGLYASAVLAIQ